VRASAARIAVFLEAALLRMLAPAIYFAPQA
jgi:hypothetical protein